MPIKLAQNEQKNKEVKFTLQLNYFAFPCVLYVRSISTEPLKGPLQK